MSRLRLKIHSTYRTINNQIVEIHKECLNTMRFIGHRPAFPNEELYYSHLGKYDVAGEHYLDIVCEYIIISKVQTFTKNSPELNFIYNGKTAIMLEGKAAPHPCRCEKWGPTGWMAIGCKCGGI